MSQRPAVSAASVVRSRVEHGPRRLWTAHDFPGLPPQAVAQALSRLCREGELTRHGKGLYYRPAQTSFGVSRPSSDAAAANGVRGHGVHPAGLSAANVLGLTTQNSMRGEYATSASGTRLRCADLSFTRAGRSPVMACHSSMAQSLKCSGIELKQVI